MTGNKENQGEYPKVPLTNVFEEESGEGSSNDISILGCHLNRRLTSVLNHKYRRLILVVKTKKLKLNEKEN